MDAQAGGSVVQVPEPVSSTRYRNRAGKCRAATGTTVSSMNRSRTHRGIPKTDFQAPLLRFWVAESADFHSLYLVFGWRPR